MKLEAVAFVLCLSILISQNYEGISNIWADLGTYIPFLNTSTYLDLLRYVIIPKLKSHGEDGETLFSAEELKKHVGKVDGDIYISILGNVFDVQEGANYYGVEQAYHGFAGRDASRAFVTGDFTEEGLTDDVLDLPLKDLHSLNEWLNMYRNKYPYKGKLVGRYFNSEGKPTEYNNRLRTRMQLAEEKVKSEKEEKLRFPPCNIRSDTKNIGTDVWCSKRSGGIERSWIGVPRKLKLPGAKSARCACINEALSEEERNEIRGYLEEYQDCEPEAQACKIRTVLL